MLWCWNMNPVIPQHSIKTLLLQWNNDTADIMGCIPLSHPVPRVAVTRADYASRLLDHLQDDAAVDVAHDVGVVWAHDPGGGRKGWSAPP